MKVKKGKNIDLLHLNGASEKRGGLWQMEYGRTPRTDFTGKSVEQNVSIENVAYLLRTWWKKTRCDTVGKGWFRIPREAMVQLTFYQPELVRHRHISVLHFRFRGEEVRCRVRRTYRNEKRKHYTIVNGFRIADLFSAYPKISSQPRRTRPFTEMSLTGGDVDGVAYLIPKG